MERSDPEKNIVESDGSTPSDVPLADWHDQKKRPREIKQTAPKTKKRGRPKGPAPIMPSPILTHPELRHQRDLFKFVKKQRKKRLRKATRYAHKVRPISLDNIKNIKIHFLFDPRARMIDVLVSEDLKKTGHYKHKGEEMAFTDMFLAAQSKRDDSFDVGRYDFEADITSNDIVQTLKSGKQDLVEPMSNELMRRNPADIYEKIARLMTESDYFEHFPQHASLLPCSYFFSKGIYLDYIFYRIRCSLCVDEKPHLIKLNYFFAEYKNEQIPLKNLIRKLLKGHFRTPWVTKASYSHLLEQNRLSIGAFKELTDSFWDRFEKTWDSLTTKQRNALQDLYLGDEGATYKSIAKRLRISVDSFQDRVSGAVKKFKKTFPELKYLKHSLNYRKVHKINNRQEPFYDHNKAKKIGNLFSVNPLTDVRTEIPIRKGKPQQLPYHYTYVEEIKAWAELKSPPPDFTDTDFWFPDLKPEIQNVRHAGDSMFKGHGRSYRKTEKWYREFGYHLRDLSHVMPVKKAKTRTRPEKAKITAGAPSPDPVTPTLPPGRQPKT